LARISEEPQVARARLLAVVERGSVIWIVSLVGLVGRAMWKVRRVREDIFLLREELRGFWSCFSAWFATGWGGEGEDAA